MRHARRTAATSVVLGILVLLIAAVASRRTLIRHLEKLFEDFTAERTLPQPEQHGAIVSTPDRSAKAWIDLGRADHVRKGQVFSVFQRTERGGRRYKGRVKIIEVKETRSGVRVIEEVDRLNPIMTGDYLRRLDRESP